MKHLLLLSAFACVAYAQTPPAIAAPIAGYCRAPQNLIHGRTDNFAANGPEMPAQISPGLQALVTSKKAPAKGFDDPTQDRWIVGSFQIPGCRVCREVIVTMNVRRKSGGLAGNDAIHVGAAPFTGTSLLATVRPWQSNTLLTKTVTISIPMAQMNQFILSQPAGPVWFDYLIQDDTEVDSVQVQIVQ